ncbi:MAG: ABC transporter ATP-binding protein [Spirochaetota bacterium]
MPILEVHNLVKKYPGVTAVDGIDLSIDEGICFGLLGPNGAGKTTTIEIIEGILSPTDGEVLYRSRPRNRQYREEIGIQFQNTELPQFLTVRETLELFRSLYSNKAKIDYLIDICNLEEILHFDNRKISGGQRQRLLLAIALANDPTLIFLDEPTTGLDPQARRNLWDIVSDIKEIGKTVILTTHYMEEAQILCDEIAIMDHGKVIALDSTDSLLGNESQCVSIIIRTIEDESVLDGFPYPYYMVEKAVEIQTEHPTECMEELLRRGIDLTGFTVRTQNLEDLFLKLTGKELRS